jgi:hypothetical protein
MNVDVLPTMFIRCFVLLTNIAASSSHPAIAAWTWAMSHIRLRAMIFNQIIVSRSSLSEIYNLRMKSFRDSALCASPSFGAGEVPERTNGFAMWFPAFEFGRASIIPMMMTAKSIRLFSSICGEQ